MLLLALVITLLIFAGGGLGYNSGAFRGPGLSLAGVVLVVILLLLITGNL